MIYRLVHGNHESRAAVHDMLNWLQLLLEADGHEVERGTDPQSRAARANCRNVLLENFFGHAAPMSQYLDLCDWVCLATESPGDGTFNEHDAVQADMWFSRFHAFRRVSGSAAEIWLATSDQGVMQRYQDLCPGQTVRVMPFPRLPGFTTAQQREKDIDVLFFGHTTDYRRYVIRQLKSYGLRVLQLGDDTPAILRNAACAQAKVGLVIPETASAPRMSGVPIWNYLQQGVCVASQRPACNETLDDIVGSASADCLIDHCVTLMDRWEIERQNQQTLFAELKPQPLGLPEWRQQPSVEMAAVIPWA